MAVSKSSRMAAAALDKLSERDRELLQKARAMLHLAYAPYSRFGVGAALRTTSGAVFAGTNMENAAYAVTLCAETSALQQSLAAGDFKVESIAVVGAPLDGTGGREIVTPCGRCRQLIFEAAQVSGKDISVLSSNADMSKILVLPISALLPYGFGPKNLAKT
jgi:cytidine deaminase